MQSESGKCVCHQSYPNCFELASGLKVNFEKSSIGGVGDNLQTVQRCASILNSALMEIPFKYLGMIVGGMSKK